MEYLREFVNTDTFQMVFKILLSGFLTGVIGLERSSLNKPAGFGTHAIIGIAATLSVLASYYMSLFYDVDAARIPASVIAGIGFIGAGTIIRNGQTVKGVTTAAGIFACTCIGLSVGTGYYIASIVTTIIVFLVITYSHDISDRFERIETLDLSIVVEKDINKAIRNIENHLKEHRVEIVSMSKEKEFLKKGDVLRVSVSYDKKNINQTELITGLISLNDINTVETHKY